MMHRDNLECIKVLFKHAQPEDKKYLAEASENPDVKKYIESGGAPNMSEFVELLKQRKSSEAL